MRQVIALLNGKFRGIYKSPHKMFPRVLDCDTLDRAERYVTAQMQLRETHRAVPLSQPEPILYLKERERTATDFVRCSRSEIYSHGKSAAPDISETYYPTD